MCVRITFEKSGVKAAILLYWHLPWEEGGLSHWPSKIHTQVKLKRVHWFPVSAV